MRDYLYIWHDPEKQLVVASGIEFKDFLPYLKTCGGVILMKHGSDVAGYESRSGFGYVSAAHVSELAAEDIYSWGDFTWADCGIESAPTLSDQEIAELLFFSHKKKPLQRVQQENLKNRILCHVHDDGWRLMVYYKLWEELENVILSGPLVVLGNEHKESLRQGRHGFWCEAGLVSMEERTLDIDSILNRRA